jgi:hypothetical protein
MPSLYALVFVIACGVPNVFNLAEICLNTSRINTNGFEASPKRRIKLHNTTNRDNIHAIERKPHLGNGYGNAIFIDGILFPWSQD